MLLWHHINEDVTSAVRTAVDYRCYLVDDGLNGTAGVVVDVCRGDAVLRDPGSNPGAIEYSFASAALALSS